jgi:hypothetical protein
MQHFNDGKCGADPDTLTVSIRITFKQYITAYGEKSPTVYHSVDDCNHGYKF